MFLNYDYFEDLKVRMAYHNSTIEGNLLIICDTKSVLIDNICPKTSKLTDVIEIYNYKNFFKELLTFLDQNEPINNELIKHFHALLCKDVIESVAGNFKKVQNYVVGANFEPTEPAFVPQAIREWSENLKFRIKNSNSLKDLLLVLASLHIQFERIHPFPDGNGRVGRALIVYSCLQLKIPPVVIKLEDRTEYLSYMNNFDEKGLAAYFKILSQKEIERMRLFQTSRDDAVIEINDDYKS